MNKEKPSYKKFGVLLFIFATLVSFAAIMPFYSKNEIQTDMPCLDPEGGTEVFEKLISLIDKSDE